MRPLGLESSTLPLSHCAPTPKSVIEFTYLRITIRIGVEFTYLRITIRIGVRLLPPIAAPTNTTTRKIMSCLLQPFGLQLVTETDETFDDMDEMH